MARKTKEDLLADLSRNKRNRKLEEAQELLHLYKFSFRPAKEQGGVWIRGGHTITLPKPHKGKPLAPTYITKVIELIEAAEIEDEIKKASGQGGGGWKKT